MPLETLVETNLRLSELAPDAVQSEIRAMTLACSAVSGINMAQGVCDTDPPHEAVAAAVAAIEGGQNIYTRLDGIAPLREALAGKLLRYNGLRADPETEIMVTTGATGAMHSACLALLNPGDECLVLEPFYGYHLLLLRSQRIVPVAVPLGTPDWALDMDRLRAAVTPRTRAIILNSPANPSGKVFSDAEMESLAEFAQEHDLFVLTDEMYEYFVFDGRKHRSIASLPGMAERTITISGFSKTFSVTGWRLGYLTAAKQWMSAIGYFHDLTYICAPAPLQHGVAAGLLELPASFYAALSTEYQAKREKICTALEAAGLRPSVPQGAYYVLADATGVEGSTAKQKARKLLADTGIATVAGSAFFATDERGYNGGENLLRVCFAKKDAVLTEACTRLANYRVG
jgi:aminotransferase